MTVFNSSASVEVEEKCECLSDVVWSALQICHLNYEMVKIFAPLPPVLVSSLFMEESPARAALFINLCKQKLKQLVE